MNFGRMLANQIARRIAYVAVALVLATILQLCGISKAHAQYSNCKATSNGTLCPDQGTAATVTFKRQSNAQQSFIQQCINTSGTNCQTNYPLCAAVTDGPNAQGQMRISADVGTSGSCSSIELDVFFLYPGSETCLKRNVDYPPSDTHDYAQTPGMTCVGGCKVAGEFGTITPGGGVAETWMRNRSYTGEACATTQIDPLNPIPVVEAEKDNATKPKSPECTALGNGQTGCVKSNGDYCATASTGKTFCWAPTETGTKVDGTNAQVKSPTNQPVNKPDVLIPDTDWQRGEGHQVTNSTGGNTTVNNITNFNQVPGTGTANNSTGSNNPDGTGNTSGNGTQTGGGTGSGEDEEGDPDSATDSGNCDVPPACTGDTLKCLHLKFTWKIQCHTKGDTIANGNTCAEGDVPVCAGSSCQAAAYSQLLQQWKSRCAAEAMAGGLAEQAGQNTDAEDEGVVDGIWGGTPAGEGMTLNPNLVVSGGGGPLLPEVQIEGQTWSVPQGFYDAIAAIRMLIIAVCSLTAMFIVGRNI